MTRLPFGTETCAHEHLGRTSFQRRLLVIVAHNTTLSIINVWLKLIKTEGSRIRVLGQMESRNNSEGLTPL